MPQWVVVSRRDCGLCEEMVADLGALLGADGAASVRVVDVDSDALLLERYGKRIPVLLADGEFVCAHRLHAERVRRLLGEI